MAEVTLTNSQGMRTWSTPSTPTSWDYAHDLTSAGVTATTNVTGTGFTIGVSYSGYGGGTYGIGRVLLDFDLSGIAAGSTINSAKLKIFGASSTSPSAYVTLAEADFIVLQGTFTDGSTLAAAMIDDVSGYGSGWDGTDAGVVEYCSEQHSSWADDAYNEITLNSDAISDITSRVGGSTRLACYIMEYDHDYHDNTSGEDGNTVDGSNDYFKINFNINPSESNPPQLVVDYDAPAPTTGPIKVGAGAKMQISSGKFKVGEY